MIIHNKFTGGNISVLKTEGNTIYVEREIRDTEGDWFYWAFCVEGAQGRTLTFKFPSENRVGWFGAAVSHDLKTWYWQDTEYCPDSFTYTFKDDEKKVYFAHDMLYLPHLFDAFCEKNSFSQKVFCITEQGNEVPFLRFGNGEKYIIATARHHACESTGNYVLEGFTEVLKDNLPDDYSLIVIPFMDFDGVIYGDQGKNRKPYDHNRDYLDSPIYSSTKTLMDFAKSHDLKYYFDFHSPWHLRNNNDHPFFSHASESMVDTLNAFGDILAVECNGLPLRYEKGYDVGPNERWNKETSPNSKNFMSKLDTIKFSLSTETPYFGLEGNKTTQHSLLLLGKAYGRSILRFIAQNP